MIATTYDVDARKVTHYLNGQVLSEEAIPDDISSRPSASARRRSATGASPSIGRTPRFAVRNLNGSMDEFALFAAALTPREIADIYERGRP